MAHHTSKNSTQHSPLPWSLGGLTLLLGILLSWQLGILDTERRHSDLRSQVTHDLAFVRARLEGAVNVIFSATSGLAEVIAHQGGISPELFNALARQAIKGHVQIRNIGIAPDNIMRMVYPLEGNRAVLGLRYSTVPEQYAYVHKAMQTSRPVFAGPHHLVQGGYGVIARVPVFTVADVPAGADPRYWGIVSVVIDFDALLDAGGIRSNETLDIGLRKLDDPTGPGTSIWGSEERFSRQAVDMTLDIPGGRWQIAATPKGGWPRMTATGSSFFYVGLLNSLFAAAFVWWLVARPSRVRARNRELQREITDRIRAEKELRFSEQKYAAIFQLMPDMVGITRIENGCFLEINSGFTNVSGWEKQEVIGRTSIEIGLWTPEARAGALRIVKEKGRLENYAFSLGTKSGEKRDGLMFLVPIKVNGEDCLCFMARDVTELKQAQRKLENERARLRYLLKTVPALIWLKDPDGFYLNCNGRFERFFGASETQIVGKTDYDFVEKEQADFFREHDRKAIAAGKPTVNEEWITYADDGHRELLEVIKTPVYDRSGALLGVIGIGWDITEKKRIEEALRNERTRFVNLVDSVDGIVWETDAETCTFTYVSRQAERLLGYPLEEWYQERFWWHHIHPEDREGVFAVSTAYTSRGEDHELEYRLLAKDGRTIWVQDMVTIVSEAGVPRWRRGIMVDTTGKKEGEQVKRNLEAQLRQAQKMEAVGRLAGGVAHDFNNHLAVILGYADLAKEGRATPEKSRGYLNQIIQAAIQSRDITRQLLAFSRQEVIAPVVLDLNTVVTSVQKGMGRFIGEDINFQLRLAEALWPVSMDPTQVDQVIMNLIVNARDAMAGGGLLLVETNNVVIDAEFAKRHSTMTAGDYVQLKVSDTGCGMSQETLQHIFEPFYTTKETGKGTGLGLATVYGIVSQNHGLVLVESAAGAGTTFTVYLPRSEDRPEKVDLPADDPVSVERAATILLVEDEETVRRMTIDMLEQSGYTTLTASTPQEALALCAQEDLRIDLLLTDVIMPGMNGRELSQAIDVLRPGIKVLFMSGYAADIVTNTGVFDSDTSFIQKPFSMRTLLDAIEVRLHEGREPPPKLN